MNTVYCIHSNGAASDIPRITVVHKIYLSSAAPRSFNTECPRKNFVTVFAIQNALYVCSQDAMGYVQLCLSIDLEGH